MWNIEDCWKMMLCDIYRNGVDHVKDDAPVREHLGYHWRIRNPLYEKVFSFSYPARTFINIMEGGALDLDGYPMKGQALVDYVTSLDDPDKILIHDFSLEHINKDGDYAPPFVYTYPERLQALFISDEHGKLDCVNQIDIISKRLADNLGTNRAVACLYQAGIDGDRVDIPCLNWLQVTVRCNIMTLHVMFRSNDIYGAWPSNMYFLTYLGLKIQEEINKTEPMVKFEVIDYHVSSAHIYETDFDAVERIVEEFEGAY